MNMQEAVKAVLSKYATFEGRASRSEFWWYFVNLVPLIGPLVLLYWEVQPGTEGTNQFGETNSR
jgi:uncharacterized membrane protein YhaH (DUF805 family)